MLIRPEQPADIPAVRLINELAFAQPDEADLVDRLRLTCPDALSLVAEDDAQVVGHILFTPARIEAEGQTIVGMGLAPMAVAPLRQRQGIGSLLVERGLSELKTRGCPFVIVLGHPDFYPRFGFEIASRLGLTCQWEDVPGEAFMAVVYDQDAMAGIEGVVKYRSEFDAAP
ncbi:N-acetyltransferase [bacterium]|nr:N-acetyltransferase [bacterium]MBU1074155.1 N-acetyltransferase [bacterium]MBU1674951.1 N-acetyltransferase [bacterium]